MIMAIGAPKSGTLGSFNIGLATSLGFVVPLSGQLDALIASGLGPFQEDVSARLNAALSATASLSVMVGDPFAGIRTVLASLAGIQAALSAAIAQAALYPAGTIADSAQYGEQLSAMTALAGTLGSQLGMLQQAIQNALQVKIPAMRAAADLTASVNAGPAFFLDFEGPLKNVGVEIGALFAGGIVDGSHAILPTQQVYGVLLLSAVPSVQTALGAIIKAT